MPHRTIRIMLADDHALFASAMGQLLGTHDDIEVVGMAGDARQVIDRVRELLPDVLLLDVEMPGPGVIPTVQTLRRVAPQVRILMLSMYDDPATIQALLGLGVSGYMLKSASEAELLAGIRRIATDRTHIVLSVTARMFGAETSSTEVVLSGREIDVLELAAEALSNSQIASRLDLREATVKRHMHNIFVKTGAVSRLDAVNKARAAGIIKSR